MKKKIYLLSLVILTIIGISTLSLGFSVNMSLDKTKNLNVNDEVVLTLNLSEEIVGASFKINYDSTNLKLVESQTTNLSVSENDGKIACVYFDMAKSGIDNLKIKFKIANNTNNNMTFNIEDAKFISKENEKSYSQGEIENKTVTIKPNTTTTEDDKKNNTIDNTTNNTTDSTINSETNNTTSNNLENNTNNNILNNNNSTNTSNDNNKSNTTLNTQKTDKTIATSKIPYAGHNILIYILIILAVLSAIYTGLRVKRNKLEDKYDK